MNIIQTVLNKLNRPKKKVDLSAIVDLENAVEEYRVLRSRIQSYLSSAESSAIQFMEAEEELKGLDSEISDMADDLYTREGKVMDALQEVEMRAEELGASPMEFIPDYQEIIDFDAQKDFFESMGANFKQWAGV